MSYTPTMPTAEVESLQNRAIGTLHKLVSTGWTKKALAARLSVSYQSVCRWTAHPPKTKPHPRLAKDVLALAQEQPPERAAS